MMTLTIFLVGLGLSVAWCWIRSIQYGKRLRQMQTVFDRINDAVIILSVDRLICGVNTPFVQLTGYTADEVVGKSIRVLWSGHHRAEFFDNIEHTLETEGEWRGEVWERRKNGEVVPVWESISLVRDKQNRPSYYVLTLTDLSPIKVAEKELDYLAHHDPLTDLVNSRFFKASVKQALLRAKRHNQHLAILFIDLDCFKAINDTFGHLVGDEVLKAVGKRLRHCVRAEDMVARLGGDEFVVLMEALEQPEYFATPAAKIAQILRRPVEINGTMHKLSASIGIGVYPEDGLDCDALLKAADLAMYKVKKEGGDNFQYFSPDLTQIVRELLLSERGGSKAQQSNPQHHLNVIALKSGESAAA